VIQVWGGDVCFSVDCLFALFVFFFFLFFFLYDKNGKSESEKRGHQPRQLFTPRPS
jgi:predicted PurR-regulated permease PerM